MSLKLINNMIMLNSEFFFALQKRTVFTKVISWLTDYTVSDRVSAMSKRSQNSDGRSSSSNTKRRRTDEKLEKKMAREATEHAEFVGGSSVPRRTGQTKSYPKEIDPKTNKEEVLWLSACGKRS